MGRTLTAAEVEALLCHGVYRQVRHSSLWTEVPSRFKDFVSAPKPNGYQSIHTNCWLADGRIVEVQIRTDAMHERAVSGTAAHQDYRASQMGAQGAGQALARRTQRALAATALTSTANALPAASIEATEGSVVDVGIDQVIDVQPIDLELIDMEPFFGIVDAEGDDTSVESLENR
uniref:RelA/SpoT domain-containing protein n=1 Tax=Haptolina brevifila TaxID=156173 RepID=A0A7S2HG57_9EUKA|mmetsp:Transcript_54356/g.107940  ORF Transcript_54356/g.107940 Transcript_54356/m.107940 type:complete len:175 (+) Transcript_54356:595-1119(+)